MPSAPHAILVLAPDGAVVQANDRARAALGLAPGSALGQPLFGLAPAAQADALRARVESVAREGASAAFRQALRRGGAGAEYPDFEVTVSRMEMDGEPSLLVVLGEASAGEGEDEQRFRSLFDRNVAAVAALDREGRITAANEACSALTAIPADELVGRALEAMVAEEERGQVRDRLAAALGGQAQQFRAAIVDAAGSRREVGARAVPIVVSGETVGAFAVLEDVTERVLAEQEAEAARHWAEVQAAQLSELAVELETSNQELLEAVERADRDRGLAEETAAEQRALIGAIGEVVLVIDAEGRYVKVPPTVPELLYRAPQELEGRRMHDVLPAESADEFLGVIHRALRTGSPVEMEYALPIEGRQTWFLAVASPMSADRVVWVARDITARREAEAALQASEERYRLVFDANPLPMWIYDRSTLRFLMVNAAAVAQYGYSREEFMALTIGDIRPNEELARFRAELSLRAEGLHRAGRWWHRRKDGSLVAVEVVAHPVAVDGHDAEMVLALDVTDREVAERALSESESTFRTLVEASPVGIVRLDEGLCAHVWNAAAQRIFGWTEDEVLGRPLPFVPAEPGDEFAAAWAGLRRGEAFAGLELRAVRRDGRAVEVSVSAAPIRGGDALVNGFIVVAADVSAARELERELRHSQKLDAIGSLAGGIAHDFNNLLTVIKGNTELAMAELAPSHPARADLEEVAVTAARAANLTRQLLTFSRKQVTEPRLYELNAIVRQAEKLLRRVLGENIAFRTELDVAAGCIRADLGQMEQVLVNLAVNARDAMPGGGTLTIRTAAAPLPPGSGADVEPSDHGYAVLQVEDTGLGIAPELLERIFEPFYTTKPQGQGTGLGLSTAYGIVKQGGGAIRVQSEVGRGTTFEILLPRFAPDGAQPEPAASAPPRGMGTVLLVEDEAAVRSVTSRILERYGYRVHAAGSGEEADEMLARLKGPVDLLITDVVMPGVSGKEVAARARELHPEIRVLFMSGYTDETISRHGVLDPDVEFIHKPFSPGAIAHRVNQILSAPPTRP